MIRRGRCLGTFRGSAGGERLTALSKVVSHALRHEPWLYELELDEEGWSSLPALLDALRGDPRWHGLERADLELMIEQSAKRRHEIVGDRIRALYGHSLPERIAKEPGEPPPVLFHGTARASLVPVLGEGLRPMLRQYVHLSTDRQTAEAVGRRKGPKVVVLRVDAGGAVVAGVPFMRGNEHVWLATHVPAAFIRVDSES